MQNYCFRFFFLFLFLFLSCHISFPASISLISVRDDR